MDDDLGTRDREAAIVDDSSMHLSARDAVVVLRWRPNARLRGAVAIAPIATGGERERKRGCDKTRPPLAPSVQVLLLAHLAAIGKSHTPRSSNGSARVAFTDRTFANVTSPAGDPAPWECCRS